MPHLRQILIDVSALIAIGVVLAVIGPFGSFEASLGARLVYWVVLALAGYALYRPIGAIANRVAIRLDLPRGSMWIAATLIATVPMTLVVWLAGCVSGSCRPPRSIDVALVWYGYVLVIGATVTLIFYVTQRGGAPIATTMPPPPDAAPPETAPPDTAPLASPALLPSSSPRFLDRLAPSLGRDLLALEMEDHYVRAHTTMGSDLILMRMRDAIGELGGVAGAQVHRSWWVARAAVTGIRREGRNVRLCLSNGLVAPVAREKVAELKAAGWW